MWMNNEIEVIKMLFNNNIVMEILQTYFEKEIELKIIQTVMEMDGYDFERIFDTPVDYADADAIDDMNVVECETEIDKKTGVQTVTGILETVVILDGYVHWSGEDEYVDSKETILMFSFCFDEKDENYYNFHIERL